MLSINDLSVSFGCEHILKNISLSLARGQILAVIGPNGSGKTTLLKSILGLQKYKGSITIDKGVKLAYLPQYHQVNHLLPLTVYEVVAQGIQAKKKWMEKLSVADHRRIEENLEKVALFNHKDEMFRNLSGGQRQRVLLALSLVNNPDFLFLDEPTNALDLSSIEIIYKILEDLKQNNVGIFIVSHDINAIITIADHVILLMHEIKYSGSPVSLSQEALHNVFGLHLRFMSEDPNCVLCQKN